MILCKQQRNEISFLFFSVFIDFVEVHFVYKSNIGERKENEPNQTNDRKKIEKERKNDDPNIKYCKFFLFP